MKLGSVAVWAIVGMGLSSAGAMAVPLPHGTPPATVGTVVAPIKGEPADASRFTAGRTLTLDARLGHASLARSDAPAETFLFASVAGADAPGVSSPPLDLAIVVDRSGSMKGDRLANAIAAAAGTVDRMRDGDTVTLVTFDTTADVVLPPTTLDATTRARIDRAVRDIRLGGDTCISCGLEAAMRTLDASTSIRAGGDRVSRMLLLSDGATNHGIKDVRGLRAMASRMRDRGVSITTIGVDVDFDEKVMAAIAQESNGRHHFVANPAGLPSVFAQEFDALAASVAQNADLVMELAPGVELDQVFDRAFRREGNRIIVPFGTFGAKQEKTVLMKMKIPADRDGAAAVASMRLVYRDLLEHKESSCEGKLALRVAGDGTEQKDLDPFVAARLARSRTSKTLTEANLLFEQGKVEDARDLLGRQAGELRRAADEARNVAPAAKAKAPTRARRSLESDFDDQLAAVSEAESNFAPPPPPADPANAQGFGRGDKGGMALGGASAGVAAAAEAPRPAGPPAPSSREGKAAVKQNQQQAVDLAF